MGPQTAIFWMPEEALTLLPLQLTCRIKNRRGNQSNILSFRLLFRKICRTDWEAYGVFREVILERREGCFAITAFARHIPGAVLAKIQLTRELIKLSYSVQDWESVANGFHNYRINCIFIGNCPNAMGGCDSTPQKRTLKIDNRMRKASSIDLHFYVNSEGAVKFKDLALEKYQVTPNEKNKIILTSPAYRQSIYSSFPCEFLAGKFETAANVTDIELHFETSTGQRLAHLLTSEMHFRIPATDLPEGVYLLKATFLDKDQRLFHSSNWKFRNYHRQK